MINDLEAPDANEEYLLYQTLLGTWPIRADGEPESAATPEYVERIQAYMAKALHEAKINTSWIQPNEEWDAAMRDFVAKILEVNSEQQVSADLPSGCQRDCATWSDQFAHANLAEADRRRVCRIFTRATRFGITAWSIPIIDVQSITTAARNARIACQVRLLKN